MRLFLFDQHSDPGQSHAGPFTHFNFTVLLQHWKSHTVPQISIDPWHSPMTLTSCYPLPLKRKGLLWRHWDWYSFHFIDGDQKWRCDWCSVRQVMRPTEKDVGDACEALRLLGLLEMLHFTYHCYLFANIKRHTNIILKTLLSAVLEYQFLHCVTHCTYSNLESHGRWKWHIQTHADSHGNR